MTFLQRYLALRKGGATQRWHTKQPVRSQSVAEHSFHAALLAMALWGENASAALLRWCLTHDLAEFVVGDVPSPTRRALPELEQSYRHAERLVEEALGVERYTQLPPDDAIRAKLLDLLEVVFYAGEQVRLGQRTDFAPIMQQAWNWVKDSPVLGVDVAVEIVEDIDAWVRGTVFPVYRCERCGELARVETDGEELRWCDVCRAHDIGTIMTIRVAQEHVAANTLAAQTARVRDAAADVAAAAGVPNVLVKDRTAPLGNDDPHDPLPLVAATGTFTTEEGITVEGGTTAEYLGWETKARVRVRLPNGTVIITLGLYWAEA